MVSALPSHAAALSALRARSCDTDGSSAACVDGSRVSASRHIMKTGADGGKDTDMSVQTGPFLSRVGSLCMVHIRLNWRTGMAARESVYGRGWVCGL